MSNRKPRIEYYWAWDGHGPGPGDYKVNWRLVGGNGEVLCQCTQGFRDKTDAERNVDLVTGIFTANHPQLRNMDGTVAPRIVGPGKKPS